MFNVGGGRACTVAEFASIVADAFGVKNYNPSASGKYRFGDTRHIFSDISRLRALGWMPRRSIEQSVEAYRGWLATADDAGAILDYCSAQMAKLNVVRDVVAG